MAQLTPVVNPMYPPHPLPANPPPQYTHLSLAGQQLCGRATVPLQFIFAPQPPLNAPPLTTLSSPPPPTFLRLDSSSSTARQWGASDSAPTGHARTHWPQLMHLVADTSESVGASVCESLSDHTHIGGVWGEDARVCVAG